MNSNTMGTVSPPRIAADILAVARDGHGTALEDAITEYVGPGTERGEKIVLELVRLCLAEQRNADAERAFSAESIYKDLCYALGCRPGEDMDKVRVQVIEIIGKYQAYACAFECLRGLGVAMKTEDEA